MKAVKIPVEVTVRGPLLAREAVPTPCGYRPAEVGDLIITDADGNEEPITFEEFQNGIRAPFAVP
jgi:hypothetical protein